MAAVKDIESWDDDVDLEGPILTNSVSTYQNSVSSRLSIRSESEAGDWNVSLAPDDERSTSHAIQSAKLAGIPIPVNVPPSALLGGTIRKLGTKKSPAIGHDDWNDDLDLPDDGGVGLKLKKKEPATPLDEDEDFDWAEGSLGVRHGGTRYASKTISPSFSLRSPSMGSVKTAESEDDGTGGLVLPTEPMDFEAALHKRRDAVPEDSSGSKPRSIMKTRPMQVDQDDFLSDIDFGSGDVFDPRKPTLNRNLKQQWKPAEKTGNTQKAQTTLTFSDKAVNTRIPRPVTAPRPSRLEPVFETATINVTRTRRQEPTTTHAQLLRSKRSAPALRQNPPASRAPPLPGVPPNFAHLQNRNAQARVPPYGALRDSDPSRAQSPTFRTHSRLSNTVTPDTPTRQRRDVAPAALAREAAAKRQITRPTKKRNFGDGTELDTFDDLPTSASKESLFIKQPVVRAQSRLRSQASQSRLGARDKMTTPMPQSTPRSPTKPDILPRFARDTAASRIAREQTLGGNKQPKFDGPLTSRTNYPSPAILRTPQSSPLAKRTTRKGPTLVAPMGKENVHHWQADAAKKGMHWNPMLYRWEGNEKAIDGFDPTPPSPPRPALITNIGGGAMGGLVSGNMVFDNQAKRWLTIGTAPSDPRSPSIGEEDDPFRDIEDLKDEHMTNDNGAFSGDLGTAATGEWLVGEEFDVGPEFIRRQKDEEMVWRQRTGTWFVGDESSVERDGYKWAIREIAASAAT